MNKYKVQVWIDEIIIGADSPEQAEEKAMEAVDNGEARIRSDFAEARLIDESDYTAEIEHHAQRDWSGLVEEE